MVNPSINQNPYGQCLIIGRFGAKHGVHGWQRLISLTKPLGNILSYNPLFIFIHKQWQKMPKHETMWRGDSLLIRLADCTSPEQAKLYTGIEIGIEKQQLPALTENEYYWSDLEGMEVYHQSGLLFGTVKYLFEAGASDILVVEGERRRMIPFVHGSPIISVDLQQKKIIVDWDPDL